MKYPIEELKRCGSCPVLIGTRLRKRWPCYLVNGVWCLTARASWRGYKPDLESEWLVVTHRPTGLRAGDIRADDPRKAEKLARYTQMLGRCVTVEGIMRRYRKLSGAQKRWIKEQDARP